MSGDQLPPETKKFWEFIGERLVIGQERYGGFKFGEHDLDTMALEEVADFAVYFMAKIWERMKKG